MLGEVKLPLRDVDLERKREREIKEEPKKRKISTQRKRKRVKGRMEAYQRGPPTFSAFLLLLVFSLIAVPYPRVMSSIYADAKKALKTSDPFDSFPKNYWQEFTSPYTETYEEEGGGGGGGGGAGGGGGNIGRGGMSDMAEEEEEVEETTTPEPLPTFEDFANSTNITTKLGNTVFLHCKVNDLRDKTVSWVRRKGGEPQLITFGLHTYSSDSRYSLNYQLPNDWKLQIKFANQRDEGHYECQVSSHPPKIFHVFLVVVVPKVEIVDERGVPIVDKFYKESSTIELKCVITHVSHSSSYVTWKHGQRILNYDTSRGGISVKTDILSDGAMSRLFIAYAKKYDSGNYTCALGDVASNTVYIYVLHEEDPAAMQHEGSGCGNPRRDICWPLLLSLLFPLLLLPRLQSGRDSAS